MNASLLLLDQSSGPARTTAFATILFGSLGLGFLLLGLAGVEVVAILRDRAVQPDPGIFAGAVSAAGVALMVVSALWAAGGALRSVDGKRAVATALALFAAVFAADDGLLIHERLGKGLTPVVALGHAALAGLAALLIRRTYGPRALWPLCAAVLFFGLSVAIDIAFDARLLDLPQGAWSDAGAVLEDLAKVTGIVVFASFTVGLVSGAQARAQPLAEGGEPT